MMTVLVWLMVTYAALKLASIARARKAGFRRQEISLWDRLRAGEPALLLLACLISVPLALLATTYAQRSQLSQYDHARTCYGRIMAFKDLPAFKGQVDGYIVAERLQAYEQMALAMAKGLEISPADVRTALAKTARYFTARSTTLPRQQIGQATQDQIAKARDCLFSGMPDPDA